MRLETIKKSNKINIWLFEKIKTSDNSPAKLVKKKRKKIEIINVRNKKGEPLHILIYLRGQIRNILNNFISVNLITRIKRKKFLLKTQITKAHSRRN